MKSKLKPNGSEAERDGLRQPKREREPDAVGRNLEATEKYYNWLSFAVILGLIVASAFSAGPVWRDEIHSLNIAQRPLSSIGQWCYLDASPVVHFLVFRLGLLIFPGGEIVATRLTGALVAVACVWAFVTTGHALGKRTPYALIFFVALQPFFLRDLILARTYGVSALFGLLWVGAVWRYHLCGGRRQWVASLLYGLLFLHSNYTNCLYFLLVNVILVAILANQSQKSRGWTLLATAVGSLLSLLPYLPGLLYERRATSYFAGYTLSGYLQMTVDFLFYGNNILAAIVLAAAGAGVIWAFTRRAIMPAALLGCLLLAICPLLHLGVLWKGSTPYLPWYLVVPCTLAGLGAEIALSATTGRVSEAQQNYWRWGNIACGALLLVTLLPRGFPEMTSRQTNMDAIAAYIEQKERPGDYIIVLPYFMGNSFHYYYRGKNLWSTTPPLSDYSLQRFDLMLPAVKGVRSGTDPNPVVEKARIGLRTGHTVWIVGRPWRPGPPGELENIRVPANADLPLRHAMLMGIASQQVGRLVQDEHCSVRGIEVLAGQYINGYEDLPLFRAVK